MQELIRGRYRLLEQFGGGAMASIYRAMDENLNRIVAVKILHTHLNDKEEHIRRFIREAHALAQLPHPNIVQIYDFGHEGERYFIVSEFVDGKDLSQILRLTDPLPVPVATIIIMHLLDAINYAHKHGVIHRDIKLENIILSRDGNVKLTDFGIAHIFEWDKLTLPGSLIGSPYYMAPEIIEGKQAVPGSDVFSIGVLFYRLLTGRFPFSGNNPAIVLRSILESTPVPPHRVNSGIDKELSSCVMACLNKNPEERPDSQNIKNSLLEYIEPLSIRDFTEELLLFSKSPENYFTDRQEDIINALTENARRMIEIRNYDRSIKLLNRAICAGAVGKEVMNMLGTAKFKKRAWLYPVGGAVAIIVLLTALKLVDHFQIYSFRKPSPEEVVFSPVSRAEKREPKTEEIKNKREVEQRKKQEQVERRMAAGSLTQSVGGESEKGVSEKATRQDKGILIIRTNPWADVYVDHKFYGRTPFVDKIELPEGVHTIEVKNPFADTVKKDVIIVAEKEQVENITLPLHPAILGIELNVEAELFIDGKLVGVGSRFENISLPQGRHVLRFEKKGYRPVEKKIDLEAGRTLSLKIDLVKESVIWKD